MRLEKWLAGSALFLVALFGGMALWLDQLTPRPPPLRTDLAEPGPGRALRSDDIWFVWLSGPPQVRGDDQGRLLAPMIGEIDVTMHRTFTQVFPSPLLRYGLETMGRYFSRHLSEDIPTDVQIEVAAELSHYDDPYGDGGGKYARFLSYQALHDLSQMLEKSPLLACTGFAVTGAASASGHTLLGRNFDFEGGSVFDREKSITVSSDVGKYKIADIAWPGMPGVITGLNDQRVWISLNAARSDDEHARGTPVSLLVRDILAQSATADEAVALIIASRPRVADLYLVADRDHAYVVEKTPAHFAVRKADPRVVVTNHFLDPQLRAEQRNLSLEKRTTSITRYERATSLIQASTAPLTPLQVQKILRDRRDPQDRPYPFGDRRALDAYIATHGVIVDFGQDTMWVSRAPHLSNGWKGINLAALFAGRVEGPGDLPADPEALAAGSALGERVPGK